MFHGFEELRETEKRMKVVCPPPGFELDIQWYLG